MVAEVPSHLDVVLDRDDIKDDLESIIDSMRSLRRESLANNKITSEDETTYRHLVHRLATSIKALTDDEEQSFLDDLIKDVARKDIAFYDVEQEKVREQNKDYFQKLRHTSFNILGELYMGLEDEYHLLQAVKHLQNSDVSNKPYTTSNDLINKTSRYHQNWFMKNVIGLLIGTKKELIPVNDTTIEIKTKNLRLREKLIKELSELGIQKIRYKLAVSNPAKIQELRNALDDFKIIENSKGSKELILEKNNSVKVIDATKNNIKSSKDFFENLNNPEKKEKALERYLNPNYHLESTGYNSYRNGVQDIGWSKEGDRLAIELIHGWQVWDFDGKELNKQSDLSLTDSDIGDETTWINSKYNNKNQDSSSFFSAISWNNTKDRLAVDGPYRLQIFDLDNSGFLNFLTEKKLSQGLKDIAWHPDGTHLVTSGCCEASFVLWDFDGQKITKKSTVSLDIFNSVNALSWSSNGEFVAAGFSDDLYIFTFNGQVLKGVVSRESYANRYVIENIEWNPDSKHLAVVQGDFINFFKLVSDKEPGITLSFEDSDTLENDKSHYIMKEQDITKSMQKIDLYGVTDNKTMYNLTLYSENKNNLLNEKNKFEKLQEILSETEDQDDSVKKILDQINEQFNPEYVHLIQYTNQEKTVDLELIK